MKEQVDKVVSSFTDSLNVDFEGPIQWEQFVVLRFMNTLCEMWHWNVCEVTCVTFGYGVKIWRQ